MAGEGQGLGQDEEISSCKEKPEDLVSQEVDGPQAEQLEFVPCGQIFQDEEEEELSPA